MYSNRSPRTTLLPDLVTALTDAPGRTPLDASCVLVVIRNSWSASGNGRFKPVPSKVLRWGAPSREYDTLPVVPPATEMVTPVFGPWSVTTGLHGEAG